MTDKQKTDKHFKKVISESREQAGFAQGFEACSKLLLEVAAGYFKDGKDGLAEAVRELSVDMRYKADRAFMTLRESHLGLEEKAWSYFFDSQTNENEQLDESEKDRPLTEQDILNFGWEKKPISNDFWIKGDRRYFLRFSHNILEVCQNPIMGSIYMYSEMGYYEFLKLMTELDIEAVPPQKQYPPNPPTEDLI